MQKMNTASPHNARNASGYGRSQRSRAAVLAASAALLESSGVGGFSVDEVARRSGVAKTTIYRHWPTRELLILDACAALDAQYDIPDTGTLYGDISAFVTDLAAMVQGAAWAAILPSIVDAAERSDEFAAMHSKTQRGHASLVHQIIEHAITRGELPADTDAAVMASTLLGPIFYRRWFTREPLDAAFLDSITVRAITGSYPGA